MQGRWRFWIDRGGTFTDCVGAPPHGGPLRVCKVLSSDDAPLLGIRTLMGLPDDAPIPQCELRLGTTLATNALLERAGRPCALLITRGFADLPVIGDQSRPELFALHIERPPPLHTTVVQLDARALPSGAIVEHPDPVQLERTFATLRAQGIEGVAIAVMHGWACPDLEEMIAAQARAHGFATVVTSSDVSRAPGLLARTDTALVDAYTTPLLREYLHHLQGQLPGSTLFAMQSSGGLTAARTFRGRDAVLSGPAGGVVACETIARARDGAAVIGFDMGGTSTDVTRWGGRADRVHETRVGGARIRTPMLSIHTVAAGGGSLCRFDGQRFTVGPQSAGATPGPLCYGEQDAHEVALTDVAVVLGRLPPDRFVFPLDVEAARAGVQRLADAADMTLMDTATGLLDIAVENMAQAIRKVTVARGYDARTHSMVVFGGAGGQYGCAVGRALGIRTLLFHPLAGALSAWGIGQAVPHWNGERNAGLRPLTPAAQPTLNPLWEALEFEGAQALETEAVQSTRIVTLRYAGTETLLDIESQQDLAEAFEAEHASRFGYARHGHPIEMVSARVELRQQPRPQPRPLPPRTNEATAPPSRTLKLYAEGVWHDASVHLRESMPAEVHGPALILEATGTIVVEPGWSAIREPDDMIVLRDGVTTQDTALTKGRDPVALEVMGSRFMAIAEQMGEVLRRTASSTNIRERLDFSCAVFDRDGGLVANAPHMPVHLGAMGESVAAVAAQHPRPRAGDVFATNDPAAGGSHLPDITVVTPLVREGLVAFWVASRGHHADVGGISPGSMPAHSTALRQEGVVFRGLRIVAGGELREADILEVLRSGPHPAREPAQNLADLQAQVSANHTGMRLLEALCDQVGFDTVTAHMRHVQQHAAFAVGQAIAALPFEHARFRDVTDDGLAIQVALHRIDDRLRIDFTGTAASGAHNLHAPRAVTIAAVLYVLRALVGRPIPLNKGCLDPIDLVVPRDSLLDPPAGAAVAGGNVETAQRVVDVLLAAVDRKAASQGTMNNLTFGNERFGYYETIGGGDGATPQRPGQDGVHTHMTNTRITDPETLELRFPIRLETFALRKGSGGVGRHRGGDGLVRTYTLREALQISLLSDRRITPPFGLAGGEPGKRGCCTIDGKTQPARFTTLAPAGTTIRVETPGGGGYGSNDGT